MKRRNAMRLFTIQGKFEQDERGRDSYFIGHFAMDEGTDEIRGYMEEQFSTPHDPVRYFKGFYTEDKKQLAFIKMCNVGALRPLAYVFHNHNMEGLWSGFDFIHGFFPGGKAEGRATVRLEEVLDPEKKEMLLHNTLQIYEERERNASVLNEIMLECVFLLRDFLNENSRYYLKQP